jgi:hypothetical protein
MSRNRQCPTNSVRPAASWSSRSLQSRTLLSGCRRSWLTQLSRRVFMLVACINSWFRATSSCCAVASSCKPESERQILHQDLIAISKFQLRFNLTSQSSQSKPLSRGQCAGNSIQNTKRSQTIPLEKVRPRCREVRTACVCRGAPA